jgi:hypothetical protein
MEPQNSSERNNPWQKACMIAASGSIFVRLEMHKEVRMHTLAFSLFTALVLSAVSVQATQLGQAAMRNWKVMDVCARQAQTAYPEYSAESNAKRDAKLKECLNANGQPPRQPFAPGSR